MLITAIENFVLFSTLFALVAFVLAALAHISVSHNILRTGPETLARFYTRALVVPPVLPAWLVIAALLPEWFLSPSAFSTDHGAPIHKLHLLSDATSALEPGLAYMTFLFVLVAAGFSIWSNWKMRARLSRLIAHLELTSEQPSTEQISIVREAANRYGLDVGLVTSSYPFSFVWGFAQSKLILSTALLRTLTDSELRGVIEHEAAHHRRRDNIVKLILSLSTCSSVAFPLSRLILKWRALEVEMICDGLAVANTGKPLEIADALLKLRRHNSPAEVSSEATAISAFISHNADHFERRIHRLIQFVDSPLPISFSEFTNVRLQLFRALICAGLFITTLAALTLFSPLSVHRFAEATIRLLT